MHQAIVGEGVGEHVDIVLCDEARVREAGLEEGGHRGDNAKCNGNTVRIDVSNAAHHSSKSQVCDVINTYKWYQGTILLGSIPRRPK